MVTRNYLVLRNGKILSRAYTKSKAETEKRLLERAGVKGITVSKKK